jgi:hypothetical protein
MGISKLNPSEGGIPYGDNAGRPVNPEVGRLYSNGESQRLELYTGATYGWQNIVAETPGVTGYSGTVLETNSTNTITITGTNFSAGATATLVGTDGTEITANTTTVNSLTSISAVFGAIAANTEPYDIRVTNPSNLYGVYYDILTVNDKPIWTTAAGSLGTFTEQESISVTVVATDEENNSVTYSLAAGSSLPSGITLNSSTGVISGTLPDIASSTTYSFTINATDSLNTSQSRAFSITSNPQPTVSSIEALVVAGGGGGGGDVGGGGGAGGIIYHATFPINIGTQYTATVGAGGLGGSQVISPNEARGQNGTDSYFGNMRAFGGARGGYWMSGTAPSGGSGGGASGSSASTGGSSTQTSNNGGTGYGNAGGNSTGSGYFTGGGGGAGAAGSPNNGSTKGGAGGIGLQTWSTWASATSSGHSGYFGGGGGGGGGNDGGPAGTGGEGGTGGGGTGWHRANGSGGDGLENTGGGGGGTGGGGSTGGTGGSGIVIIRYASNFADPSSVVNGTKYTSGGYKYYKFTSTGSVTF